MLQSSPLWVKGPRRAAAPVLSSRDRPAKEIDKERPSLLSGGHPAKLSKGCREQSGQAACGDPYSSGGVSESPGPWGNGGGYKEGPGLYQGPGLLH